MTKEQYLIFLSHIYTKRDGNLLSPSSVNHYGEEALGKINYFVNKKYPQFESVFDILSFKQLNDIKEEVFSDPDFIELNKRGNNMYSAGFKRYLDFASGHLLIQKSDSLKLMDVKEPVKYQDIVSEKSVPTRDRIKIIQSEMACNYNCQIDYAHKSFIAKANNKPYMEGHHIIPLNQQKDFKYSLDCYANILVLCPNCHRFLHYGLDNEKREKLIIIYENRVERLFNCGIEIDRKEFLERVCS